MFVFVHVHGLYLSCSFYAIYGWEENMIMCLMWTRLLQYFGKADVARRRVDLSLPWFAVRNPAMMLVPNFLLWSLVVGASSYFEFLVRVLGGGPRRSEYYSSVGCCSCCSCGCSCSCATLHVVLRVAYLSGIL